MNRLVLSIITCLYALTNPVWAEDKLSISDFEITPGVIDKEFSINLDNDVAYAAFQFDLYLPNGLTVTDYTPNPSRLPENTTLDMKQQPDGCYRFIAVANNLTDISGTNGCIITIKVSANNNTEFGELNGSFKNIKLSKKNGFGNSYDEMTFPIKVVEPSIIRVRNYTREYGEQNPKFEYNVEGGEIIGEPVIKCNATETSAVGSYPITIEKGSIKNDIVTFINDSTLTVTKAPLNIAAGTYTKKQGEAMPEFTLTYTGFKNNETKDVLTKQPEVSCNATESSAPGEYPVTVSGAEAQNYDISYTSGKLVVVDANTPVLISSVTLDKTETELIVGEIVQLNATISPDNATTKSVTWSSSNESIAVVNESGQVTAVSAGLCNITATANDGSGVSASCLVTVLGNVLYCEDLGAVPGATINLPILLTNADDIQGFDFKLVLPEGISVETDSEGKLMTTLTDRAATQGLEGLKQSSNTYQFVFTSTNRLLGTSGAVVIIPLVVADNVAVGSYDVVIKDVKLMKYGTSAQIHHGDRMAKLTIREMTLGDVNGDNMIDTQDAILVIQYYLGANPTNFNASNADVNGDGNVDTQDAILIIQSYLSNN